MSYFPDLTHYQFGGRKRRTYLNIGWLDNAHGFPVGDCPLEFAEHLLEICRHPVDLMRGFHECNLCDSREDIEYVLEDGSKISTIQPIIQKNGRDIWLGNGEVEVPDYSGTLPLTFFEKFLAKVGCLAPIHSFRAPTLIYHYVTAHKYKPPQAFVDAVLHHRKLSESSQAFKG